jgi:hypothetical protein
MYHYFTIDDPPDIDLMVVLEAKNVAVPNVVPFRYKFKLTEEISDLICFRNQCRQRWGQNKNRELKKYVNKLTKDLEIGQPVVSDEFRKVQLSVP